MRVPLFFFSQFDFMIGPSSFQEVFHLATMGGAEVLGLADVVGNFLPGKQVRQCIVQCYIVVLFLILFYLQEIRDGIPQHPQHRGTLPSVLLVLECMHDFVVWRLIFFYRDIFI